MNTSRAWKIDLCRGVEGECRNALPLPKELPARLEQSLERSLWLQELARRRLKGVRPHQQLRLTLSGCANGCSRPQTADLGLLAAWRPAPPLACSGCGACADACPDGLIQLREQPKGVAPVIDADQCLDCGACIRACPEESMELAAAGLRVQVGGKLGRRPLLAAELPQILDADAAVDVLERALAALWEWNSTQNADMVCRLADLRRKGGLPWLLEQDCCSCGS